MPRLVALLLLVAGCQPKEEAPPALALSAAELAFGEVGLGSTSELTFTLTNSGGGEVELLSVSLIEGQSSIFDVERDPIDLLTAGEATTVTVSFSPADQRAYAGRIQVRSDDPANPSLYVDLSGDGAPSTLDNDGDGYSPATGDCNDGAASMHPGATESCDGLDNDCDGTLPADERDGDYDGWLVCEGDCNDGASSIYPGAPEICDHQDSDCDGVSADTTDADGDGYSICDDDCDDAEPLVYPYNPEACDGLDNDCSGDPDDIDEDRDGHSPCGAAGDCDDTNPRAYPVVVDDDATGKADGTEERPYRTLEDALANLDDVCRTVQLNEGTYEVALTWTDGELRVAGAGFDPSVITVTPPAGSRAFDVGKGGDLTVANLTLTGAAAKGDGGAARVVGGALTLEGIVATGNTCTGDGGAVAMSAGDLTILDALFDRNIADDDGGAVAVLTGRFTDNGSTYQDNTAVRGGALLIEASEVQLADLSIVGNEATDQGGGIELIGGSGVWLERLYVALNAGGFGGGLAITDLGDGNSVLRNSIIADNASASDGGGLAVGGGAAAFVVANNTFVGNDATGEGGGVYVGATNAEGLYLWSNILGWSGGDSGVYSSGGGASVDYNLFYASASGTEYEVAGGEDGGNNLTDNPDFRTYTNNGDPTDDALALNSGSPAVNSGPAEGAGPAYYQDQWPDEDGSRNNRGHLGGQGASE